MSASRTSPDSPDARDRSSVSVSAPVEATLPSDADPSRLEREIDHTRARISRTVDALEDKLSPREFADQAIDLVRARGGEFASNLMDHVQRNPLPAIVTAAGLLWLMAASQRPEPQWRSAREVERDWYRGSYREGPGTTGAATWQPGDPDGKRESESKIQSAIDGARETVEGAAERAAEIADGLRERSSEAIGMAERSIRETGRWIRGTSHEAYERAHDAYARVRDEAGHAGTQLRHGSDRVQQKVARLMDEQPIVVGAIGVAIGAALGAMLPSSRAEDAWMGDTSDRVVGRFDGAASEGFETVRDRMAEVVDETVSVVVDKADAALGRTDANDAAARDDWSGGR